MFYGNIEDFLRTNEKISNALCFVSNRNVKKIFLMLTRNCRWCQLQNEALNEHFGTYRRKMILRTKGNEI